MFTKKDFLLRKLLRPSSWAVIGLAALPLWVQAQTVISAPKPTVRSQPVQVESVAPAIAPVQAPVSKGSDAIRVLSELEGLREELAALRNEIEIQQHELEKLGKRQQELEKSGKRQQELVGDVDKQLNQQGEQLSQREQRLSQQEEQLSQQEERVSRQEERLSQQQEQLSQQGERVSQQQEQLSQQEERLKQQEELVSAAQNQLAEFRAETTEKIASIDARAVNQKIQDQTTQPKVLDVAQGGGLGEQRKSTAPPARPSMQASGANQPIAGSPAIGPGATPPTVAAVPTTHPPSGISVTNSNIASPILAPRSNQPASTAARPVAVGGGLGSASPVRVPVPDGPMAQVTAPSRDTRSPTNVAINKRPPAASQINLPIGDPAAEQAAYENAFELLKQSRYNEAIRGFNSLLFSYPGSALADDAQYWIAEAHYVTRGFEAALLGFRTVVARYPSSPRVADAMLRIGYIQYEVGAYNQARQTLTELVTRYPSSRVAVSAETRLKKMIQEGR